MQWMSTGPALEHKTIFSQINVKRTVKSELLVNLSSREPSWPNSDTSSRTFKPGAQKLKLSTGDCGQSHFETNSNGDYTTKHQSQPGRSLFVAGGWALHSPQPRLELQL